MIASERTDPRASAVVSQATDTAEAAREACRAAKQRLGGQPHLAVVFASIHHQQHFQTLAEIAYGELQTDCLLGCTGESIVCNEREIEDEPALAVWLAHLPDTQLLPIRFEFESTPDGATISGWPDELDAAQSRASSLLLLADPYSFPADALLARLNEDRPGLGIVGGMASGGRGPGENRLLLGQQALDTGAVAILMQGATRVRSVVSQGCRPIGRPLVVTKAEDNVILELGGRPALAQLQEIFAALEPEVQALVRNGLHLGQVVNEYQERFGRGDFLVRNVQGADPDSGAIAVGDVVRVGHTVQFQVRDAATADEDLEALLSAARTGGAEDCLGALLFTCNGRGTRLFDAPHHDARCLSRHLPGVPVAGFFAQGEIGPVGGKSFVHGFTASIALFEY